VWAKAPGESYAKINNENIEAEAYTALIDQLGTWNFKVRGLNIEGTAGSFSNEITLTVSTFAPVTDGERTYEVK